MKHAYINQIKQWFSVFRSKLPTVSLDPTSLLLITLHFGSRTKDTGASTNLPLPFPLKKKTGQKSAPGRGKTLAKLAEFPTSRTTAALTAKPRTKSAPKKSTKSSKPVSPKSTGKSSKKTQTTSKARSN